MDFILIKKTLGENIFEQPGFDTAAGAGRFVELLKARWRGRAKREWGEGVMVCAKITIEPATGYCPDLEIVGENAAKEEEDLSWQRQGYEDDILALLGEFDQWAVPITEEG
jgi:hypothetical protein